MTDGMDQPGSIEADIVTAVRSARRLRGHPIHEGTIQHWADLLHQARRHLAAEPFTEKERLDQLIADLDTELAGPWRAVGSTLAISL
jgi:hypothetical protein